MATQRKVFIPPPQTEKHITQAQGGPPSSSIVSDIRPAVSSDVIIKLLAFTFAMAIIPIGSYFFTLRFVFRGNSTYSGAFAAIMANVVLIGYIVVAMREDDDDGKGGNGSGKGKGAKQWGPVPGMGTGVEGKKEK